jgi:hypothetical protein
LAQVQAAYYSYLPDQQSIPINLNIKSQADKKKATPSAVDQSQVQDKGVNDSKLAVETHSEHFMPFLMKYLLENMLGALPYPVQSDIRHYGVQESMAEIDMNKVERASGKKQRRKPITREALLQLDSDFDRKRLDLDQMSGGIPRDESKTTLNVETVEMNSDHQESLDDPQLYFGEEAVDKFWDFYKSDRKFKDFTDEKE